MVKAQIAFNEMSADDLGLGMAGRENCLRAPCETLFQPCAHLKCHCQTFDGCLPLDKDWWAAMRKRLGHYIADKI